MARAAPHSPGAFFTKHTIYDAFAFADTETDAPSSDDGRSVEDESIVFDSKPYSSTSESLFRPRGAHEVAFNGSSPCWLTTHSGRVAIVQPRSADGFTGRAFDSAHPGIISAASSPTYGAPSTMMCGWQQQQQQGQDAQLGALLDQSEDTSDVLQATALQKLRVVPCTEGCFRIVWDVDARKLHGKDKSLVSPVFELPLAGGAPFRVLLHAKKKSQKKNGENFSKSRGVGSLQLKCDASQESLPVAAPVQFSVSLGPSTPMRGPFPHDFACESVASLPASERFWDFRAAADKSSEVLTVCVLVQWA